MRYRIQVFHPAANAYLPTSHVSTSLRALRRIIATGPLGPTHARIVDETGTPVPDPQSPNPRPLTLHDIAHLMGTPAPRPHSTPASIQHDL